MDGYLPNAELQKKYSWSEGTNIISAEAFHAGASIAGPRLILLMNCLQWYVFHDSGTPSPEKISRYWCSLLHAENSCKRIIADCEAAKGRK